MSSSVSAAVAPGGLFVQNAINEIRHDARCILPTAPLWFHILSKRSHRATSASASLRACTVLNRSQVEPVPHWRQRTIHLALKTYGAINIMKQNSSVQSRFKLPVSLLAGCLAISVSSAALGQAGSQQNQQRQSNYPATQSQANQPGEEKTFEGKLVPLFSALKGDSATGSTGLQRPSTQPGVGTQPRTGTQPDTRTQPGVGSQQPGTGAQPDTRTQPDVGSQQSGTRTQPDTRTQPGIGSQQSGTRTQPDIGTRPGASTQPGLGEQHSTLGMSHMGQPLALIADSSAMSQSQIGATRSTTPEEGRLSTPDRTSPSTSPSVTSPGTTPSAQRYAQSSEGKGDIYVLVFDPSDPESRSAYMMAQTIAGSSSQTGSTIGRSSIGTTPSSTDSPDADRQQVRDQTSRSITGTSTSSGEEVKVTGRVIERDGIQAIAVQRVERKHDSSPSALPSSRVN
jgi:hypothetical protein